MEKKYVDLGYEFWNKGYMFRKSINGEREAYDLYCEMLDNGSIESVEEFIDWVLENEPSMVYDYRAEEKKYREENEPKIREFFAEHIEGRAWRCIDPEAWEFYSDWHKDVFGYRPHGIVCGEYINPHI